MAAGDQGAETATIVMEETVTKADTTGVVLSLVERQLEMTTPAGGGLSPALTIRGGLLVQNTGCGPLLERQMRTARRRSVRDIITITNDADRGVDQAVGQGPPLEGLRE